MAPPQSEGMESIQWSESNSILESITKSIADKLNTEPLDLPPLFQSIDPEALEDLITSSGATTMQVTFLYAGCKITVTGNRAVSVEDQSSVDIPN